MVSLFERFETEFLGFRFVVLGAVEDALGCFQRTQSSDKQMLMIVEHRLILNGIAKTLDLLANLGLGVEMLSESFRYGIATEISVLNWSWIAVSVLHFPISLLGLEVLIGNIVQFDLLRWHDELLSSVSALWLRLKEGEDWNGTDSPLGWMLDHILNCNSGSVDTRVKQDTCSKSRGGSKRAVKGCRMGGSTLITEEVRDWREGTIVGLGSLSLLQFFVDEVGDELLSLKLREVDVGTAKLLVVDDLSLHEIWQSDVEGVTPWSQHLSGLAVVLVELLEKFQSHIVGLLISEDIIKLHNKMLVG